MLAHFSISQQGEGHIAKDTVCQDYSRTESFESAGGVEYVVAAIADGVGSCDFSDRGAQTAVDAAVDCVGHSLQGAPVKMTNEWMKDLLVAAFTCALNGVEERASLEQLPYILYDSTLTLAIFDGMTAWIGHIGDDGAVVMHRDGRCLMATHRHKGDVANMLIPLREKTRWEFVACQNVASLVLMTDGILDHCVSVEALNNRVYLPFLYSLLYRELGTPVEVEHCRADWDAYLRGEEEAVEVILEDDEGNGTDAREALLEESATAQTNENEQDDTEESQGIFLQGLGGKKTATEVTRESETVVLEAPTREDDSANGVSLTVAEEHASSQDAAVVQSAALPTTHMDDSVRSGKDSIDLRTDASFSADSVVTVVGGEVVTPEQKNSHKPERLRDKVRDDITIAVLQNSDAVHALPPFSFDFDAWNCETRRYNEEVRNALREDAYARKEQVERERRQQEWAATTTAHHANRWRTVSDSSLGNQASCPPMPDGYAEEDAAQSVTASCTGSSARHEPTARQYNDRVRAQRDIMMDEGIKLAVEAGVGVFETGRSAGSRVRQLGRKMIDRILGSEPDVRNPQPSRFNASGTYDASLDDQHRHGVCRDGYVEHENSDDSDEYGD